MKINIKEQKKRKYQRKNVNNEKEMEYKKMKKK